MLSETCRCHRRDRPGWTAGAPNPPCSTGHAADAPLFVHQRSTALKEQGERRQRIHEHEHARAIPKHRTLQEGIRFTHFRSRIPQEKTCRASIHVLSRQETDMGQSRKRSCSTEGNGHTPLQEAENGHTHMKNGQFQKLSPASLCSIATTATTITINITLNIIIITTITTDLVIWYHLKGCRHQKQGGVLPPLFFLDELRALSGLEAAIQIRSWWGGPKVFFPSVYWARNRNLHRFDRTACFV